MPSAVPGDPGRRGSDGAVGTDGLPRERLHEATTAAERRAAGFARDSSLWEHVESRVIPRILAEKDAQSTIRAWVPFCGTGEDAYTLAMLLIERSEAAGRAGELRVFATGANPEALAFGRRGLYPMSIATELSPERLRRFFVREARGFRVEPDLRGRIFFAAHDIVHDPPYAQLDLIYWPRSQTTFDVRPRESIDPTFRRSLRTGGFLVQGPTDPASASDPWFEVVSDVWGVHRRTASAQLRARGDDLMAMLLTRQLRVGWFTPEIMRLFELNRADRDRPVEELARRLGDPDLPGDTRAVLESGESTARLILGPRSRWFIRRLQLRQSGVIASFVDVTFLKEAESEAREAHAYLQSIVDTIREPLVVLDANLRVRSANRSYYRIFGTSPADTEGRSIHDPVGGHLDDPRLRGYLEWVQAEGRELDDYPIEAQIGPAGRRTLRLNARRVEGMPLVLLGIDDITERRKTSDDLEKSRRRLKTLFDNAQDAILLADDRGRYLDANPAACAITGYSRAELIERSVLDLTPEIHRPDGMALWSAILRRGRLEGEYQLFRKDGRLITLEFRAVANVLPGVHLSMLRDISERRRLEKEVLEIASTEQRRIGQELHDDAGQMLTGLSLMAGVLADRLDPSTSEGRIAARIAEGIGQVLDQLRGVARGLIPVQVDVEGLMAALAELAFQTDELEGIDCRFDCDEPVTVRDNTTATQLYRIAQEAVTNAIRHGRPKNVRIALKGEGPWIRLEVSDDGVGVPESIDERAGRGLRMMRYRAGLVGASLSIGRAPAGGTLVRCVFSEDDHHA
jgi:PAS domain S-box-containing protein